MMTVKDYASIHNVSPRTVYRWIENGKVNAEKRMDRWIIVDSETTCDGDETEDNNKEKKQINQTEKELPKLLEQLQSENEYLREELSQANQTIADMQERHDTIVMSLSNQVDRQQKMLEDLRGRKLWTRIKAAFGFAAS